LKIIELTWLMGSDMIGLKSRLELSGMPVRQVGDDVVVILL